ncbi:CDP-glycerol glycerophosphotransferase family protein [Microlunatus aurantiacus]|uniref:CDP-glycerol glycerophosphotransferase family protein n=1 Tax=Microlunatus aurantiacus TaxID=446786 RepID=UPI0031E07CAF
MSTRSPGSSRSSGSSVKHRVRRLRAALGDFAVRNVINLGAVVSACVLLAADGTTIRAVGALAGLAALVGILARRWSDFYPRPKAGLLGYFVSVRLLLVVAVGGLFLHRRPDAGALEVAAAWTGLAVLLLLVMAEPLVKTLLGTTKVIVRHLPGVKPVPKAPLSAGWIAAGNVLAVLVAALLAALGAPGWTLLLPALATVPPTLLTTVHALRATEASKRIERDTPAALRAYAPAFVVYYATVQGARYQLGMWLPYLERLGKPYVVITRNPATVAEIARLTKAPILVPRTDKKMSDHLDSMVVPSMKAAFYVQGSAANATFQRYQMTHVWLNHGDSDKQANYHPRHATYDKLFVSGQQGVDRYAAHGIEVPPGRFAIVGRPQIESIMVADEPLPAGTPRTILYAPTWKGGRPSTNYSSLPNGLTMIKAVLERGSTVVFRPHPLSYNDRTDAARIAAIHELLAADRTASGRQHVWGAPAEKEWDIPACFNHSDALITDVSSVASDFLASGKPFAMCAVQNGGEEFLAEFPTARVAYVIEPDLSTLDSALDHLHGDDPLAERRRAYRTYCLGENIGPSAADGFLRVAGDLVA